MGFYGNFSHRNSKGLVLQVKCAFSHHIHHQIDKFLEKQLFILINLPKLISEIASNSFWSDILEHFQSDKFSIFPVVAYDLAYNEKTFL